MTVPVWVVVMGGLLLSGLILGVSWWLEVRRTRPPKHWLRYDGVLRTPEPPTRQEHEAIVSVAKGGER